jgi:transcriptional regulator with XRE-family HTH domain
MRKVDKHEFGARVKLRREKLELSQDDVAEAIGMSQQGVDNIEHGKVGRPRLMMELAEALGTTEKWLLWKVGPEEIQAHIEPEDILSILQKLRKDRRGLAMRFLKTLAEKDVKAA